MKLTLVAAARGSEMPTAAELAVAAEYPALEENAQLLGWMLELLSSTSFAITMAGSDGSAFSVLCVCDR